VTTLSPHSATSIEGSTWRKREGEKERRSKTLAIRKRREDKLMKYVRGLHSMEQVPIASLLRDPWVM
jgi:ribosomal protein S2